MAYAATDATTPNPPRCVSQSVGATGGDIWIYKDGDDVDTVTGINYITDATELGMKAGDRVILIDETNGLTTDLTVQTGATTGTASGATGSAVEPIAETSIALSSAGTGTILVGDIITFGGHTDGGEYRVTTGDTDVSDGGTLVITPALTQATVAGGTITVKSDVLNLTTANGGGALIASTGATQTLTKAESGSTVLYDRAAGIVYTLPASVPGLKFTFETTVDLTSNAYAVVTDGAFIVGSINGAIEGAATGEVHFANGTTHVGVSSNKTTTGGLIGSSYTLECISSTLWRVTGTISCTATPATPFTT